MKIGRFLSLPLPRIFAASMLLLAGLATTSVAQQSGHPDAATVLKEAKKVEGLIPLYRKNGSLIAELAPSHFNRDFIVLISISRGIGEGPLLGGMSWNFGDDMLWQFRKVEDRVQIVRRNVRFKADAGSPEAQAVKFSYTDSVLFGVPIITTTPAGGTLIDLSPVFMSDLPQISQVLPGFAFTSQRSSFDEVKGFPDNIELSVAATYASGGNMRFDGVPDSRGVTIGVHYSISLLPQNGYHPRLADDRVGYFLTVVKDYSKKASDDQFVRYINRWDLQKADASAEMSPPKKPIIFWLEKTIPFKYRKPISDAILEWNKGFEKAGFLNAIEVRQQPDNASWDPEDINYNTFRWITAGASMAMGPSRVNPLTGQILDADIIFDSDFIQFWKESYETFTPASVAAMTGGAFDLKTFAEEQAKLPPHLQHNSSCRCMYHQGRSNDFAFGSAFFALAGANLAAGKPMEEKMVMQGIKEIAMHEVGHTLGLRHNFKASTWRSLDDLNDPAKTKDNGTVASVMDYAPINIVPQGRNQGDYYSTTIGPYDVWAIEYGYKPLSGGTTGEVAELQKIAARCGEPALAFSTDEDTRGIDPDPLSNRFDLGSDPIAFARQRAELISKLWPGLADRVTEKGEGYQKARRAFGILLGNYGTSMYFASRFVGGLYTNRDHKGDANSKPPFVVVEAAKQRDALTLLEQQVFSDKPFNFPPELYNYLAPSKWMHWGSTLSTRPDYPVHEVILMWQDRILAKLLSPLTLQRLCDSELKIAADKDALTSAELLERLTKAIFAEINDLKPGEYTNRKPAISSLRRNLQRTYLKRLASVALDTDNVPEDCQTIAHAQLDGLNTKLKAIVATNPKLDSYTLAHLKESQSRIQRILDAKLSVSKP